MLRISYDAGDYKHSNHVTPTSQEAFLSKLSVLKLKLRALAMSKSPHSIPLDEHAAWAAEQERSITHKSNILPHTIEAGDPYYIGDVYEPVPSASAQEWEIDW